MYSNRGINNPWGICTGLVCEKGWYTIAAYGSDLSRSSEKSSRKLRVFWSKCLKGQVNSHSLFCVHVFLVNKTWTKYVFVIYYWINQFIEKRVYFNQFLCSLYIFSCIFLQWRCICFCKQVVYIVLKIMYLNLLMFFTIYWLKKIYSYKNTFKQNMFYLVVSLTMVSV